MKNHAQEVGRKTITLDKSPTLQASHYDCPAQPTRDSRVCLHASMCIQQASSTNGDRVWGGGECIQTPLAIVIRRGAAVDGGYGTGIHQRRVHKQHSIQTQASNALLLHQRHTDRYFVLRAFCVLLPPPPSFVIERLLQRSSDERECTD